MIRVADLEEGVNQRALPLGLEGDVKVGPGAGRWWPRVSQLTGTVCQVCLATI